MMHKDPIAPGERVALRGAPGAGVVVAVGRDPLSLNRRPVASVLWWDNMVEEDVDVRLLRRCR